MRAFVRIGMTLVLALLATGCYQPRREKPHERITRLRLQYRIEANWYENRKGSDGQPALFMSLSGRNLGREGLAKLTMIMHVRHYDGTVRLSQPLTLDVTPIAPQAPRATPLELLVPGVEVREGEELALQLEDQPHQDTMPSYPEYAGTTSWAPAAAATRTVAR